MGSQLELFPMPRCPNCWSEERIEQVGFSEKPAVVFYHCLNCQTNWDEPASPDQRPVRSVRRPD
jgi:hypothetical protein